MRRRTPRPNKTHAGAAREAQRLFRLAVPKALGITEAGTALVVADDAAAQREALELGTAAVADDAAFASASHTHTGADVTTLIVENRTSDPGSPEVGRIWLRTDL